MTSSSAYCHLNVQFQINYRDKFGAKMVDLLETGGLSDVMFLVGEQEIPIRAHKMILAISSPVFMSMFYGPLKETTSTIRIPDCNIHAFKMVLKSFYGDNQVQWSYLRESSIDVPYLLSVMYIAHKYDLKNWEVSCISKLKAQLDTLTGLENAFEIYRGAEMFNLNDIKEKSWKLIQNKTESVLKSNPPLDSKMLLKVVKDDGIKISEVKLFQFILTWAQLECEREAEHPTLANTTKRMKDILNFIRFPLMTSSDFANLVVPTGVLNNDQIAKIFTYICSSKEKRDSIKVGFPTQPRPTPSPNRSNGIPYILRYNIARNQIESDDEDWDLSP